MSDEPQTDATLRSSEAPSLRSTSPSDAEPQASRPEASAKGVERKLHKAWSKERRFYHVRGLCFLLVWVVAIVLVDLLVDWLFLATYRVPGWGRVVLLAINLGMLAWVVHHYWWRYLRSYSPVRVALQVERRHPELKSLLVSYVQIDERLIAQTQASPALVRAVRREAMTATRPLDFREIVSFNTLARLFAFSACVLGLFGGISAYKSDFLLTLIQRMVNPGGHLEYPTRTVIEQISGNMSVQQGSPVAVTAVCGGEIPEHGWLYLRGEGGSWETHRLPNTGGNVFSYRFSQARRSFDYYVEIGDDESDEYHVEVIPAPTVVRKEIVLTPPPYTKLDPRVQDSYYIEVLEGTAITWRLTCDRPVDSASILQNRVDAIDMRVSADRRHVECSLVARETFEYQFRWQLSGHPFVYTSPSPYVVNVVPDGEPQAEILQPLQDERATVRKTIWVTFTAEDLYGLSEARLVYTVGDGPEKRWTICPLTGKSTKKDFQKKLTDLIPDLKEDVVVTYWIEVADNYPGRPAAGLVSARPGPNVARSQKRRVYIVSIVDYLRSILEERLRWVSEVEELRGEETTAADQVDTMKKSVPQPATRPSKE